MRPILSISENVKSVAHLVMLPPKNAVAECGERVCQSECPTFFVLPGQTAVRLS